MTTLPHCVLTRGREAPHEPAHLIRDRSGWLTITWGEYADAVRRAGRALLAAELAVGERVALLAEGGPTWVVADIAAMAVGALPVGICAHEPEAQVGIALAHLDPSVVVISSRAQWDILCAHRARLPALRLVVTTPTCEVIDDPQVVAWDALMATAERVPEERFAARLGALQGEAPATLIYETVESQPRAAVLTHRNLMWSAQALVEGLDLGPTDSSLSFLPPALVGEQLVSIYAPAVSGAHVHFSTDLARVATELRDVQPTIFFGVPRVWNKLYALVASKLDQTTGWRKLVVSWARSVSSRFHRTRELEVPSLWLRFLHQVASRLVLAKIRAALGLARTSAPMSTTLGMAPEAAAMFASLDVPVRGLYGRSETSGIVAIDGRAVSQVEVKVASDGELLVRGPNVFLGYFEGGKLSQAPSDGWLHTGDLGRVEDGRLRVFGAKRDALVTTAGRSVAPSELESKLKGAPFIDEVVVVGDRQGHLSALIAVDESVLAASLGGPPSHAELGAAVEACITLCNRRLGPGTAIHQFRLLPRGLTIHGGELTPGFEVRRSAVAEHFAELIDSMSFQ